MPAWIAVDSFRLVDNPDVDEGALTHDITDAWIFVDDELLGIDELPAMLPVLDEGNHKVMLGPGIKVSTISTLRDNYLFLEAFETTVQLIPGETLHLTPTVRYRNESNDYTYIVVEDFEDSFLDVQQIGGDNPTIERTTDPALVRSGNGSGILQVTDTAAHVGFRTSEWFELPRLGKLTYLEIDYYTEYNLIVGLEIDNGTLRPETNYYMTLRASEPGNVDWKKAYINLTEPVNRATNFQSAYIFFIPDRAVAGRPDQGIVLIDNIKIMHQQ